MAIGENDEKIKEELRKNYKKTMTIKEAIRLGMSIFKTILGDKFNTQRFNIAYIENKEGKLRRLNKEEIAGYK